MLPPLSRSTLTQQTATVLVLRAVSTTSTHAPRSNDFLPGAGPEVFHARGMDVSPGTAGSRTRA